MQRVGVPEEARAGSGMSMELGNRGLLPGAGSQVGKGSRTRDAMPRAGALCLPPPRSHHVWGGQPQGALVSLPGRGKSSSLGRHLYRSPGPSAGLRRGDTLTDLPGR